VERLLYPSVAAICSPFTNWLLQSKIVFQTARNQKLLFPFISCTNFLFEFLLRNSVKFGLRFMQSKGTPFLAGFYLRDCILEITS
jgi:hypothetical protein